MPGVTGLVFRDIFRRAFGDNRAAAIATLALSADTASAPLGAVLESNDPAGGISGASILYEVVDTLAAQGSVRFQNGNLVVRATTSTGGAPSPGVTLRKVPGGTPPATVQVRVSATRPSGTPVPGSGQLFVLTFQ